LEAEEVAVLVAEGIDTSILTPGEFAIYACLVGVIFMTGHWLVGHLWPDQWVPGKRSTRAVVIIAAGYMALAVLPIVIWAPIKLAVLIGGTLLLMRRGAPRRGPSIIEQLHGTVPARRVLALSPLPLAASISYGLVYTSGLTDDGLGAIYWTLVMTQVIGGFVAYIWAARRSLRDRPRWETPTIEVVSGPLQGSRR
jgi:hypothetical protein